MPVTCWPNFFTTTVLLAALLMCCWQPVHSMTDEEHFALFEQAVDEKNEANMMTLIKQKSPFPVDMADFSILHYCACARRPEYLRKYLTLSSPKPDLNPRTENGMTPLMYAFIGGNSEIIDAFLEQDGLDVHAIPYNHLDSTLMYAARTTSTEQFKKFLAYSKDMPLNINYQNMRGESVLFSLLGYDERQKQKLVLFLEYAAGKLELPNSGRVQHLLMNLNMFRSLDQFVNIWRRMKPSNRLALLQGSDEDMSLLCIISHTNIAIWMEWLRTPGIDMNVRCNVERKVPQSTPLMLLIDEGEWPEARLMLNNPNIRMNLQDQNGFTALMYATISARLRSEVLVQELLNRRDVDVNVQNNHGFTALMCLTTTYAQPKDRAKTLVERFLNRPDINVELTNTNGQTAMDLAMSLRDVELINLYKKHFFRPILFYAKGVMVEDRLPNNVIFDEVQSFVAKYAPTYANELAIDVMTIIGEAKPRLRASSQVSPTNFET